MGVGGLDSFTRFSVDGGFRIVNIREEALKAQRQGRNPILIVDLLPFHYYIHTNEHEKLLGGRFNKYKDKMEAVLYTLKSMGYELLFFVDGAMQPDKIQNNLKRRQQEYERAINILHKIDEGLDLTTDLSKMNIPGIKAFFENLIHIAKNYGEVHVAVLNECDQEIVRLANKKKALAIISSDTDYLIFDGPWRFWNDLDLVRHTAKEYDKNRLRNFLYLSPSQMKLLASLAGNDFVSKELLRDFHQKLNPGNSSKFQGIADKVRQISTLSNEALDSLAQDIFKAANYEQGLKALRKSIDFYSLAEFQESYCDDFQEQVAQRLFRFVYSLLYRNEIIMPSTFCHIDADFYKPLLCRLMGILFSHRKIVDAKKTFYFQMKQLGNFEKVTLLATFPPGDKDTIPQLETILLTPYGENSALDAIRWKLLCFIISPDKLNPEELRSIALESRGMERTPDDCGMATYLTLFYLVKANLIQVDEADCILISCNAAKLRNLQDKFSFDNVRTIDGRDARVAFLFLRMMHEVSACFSAVGLQQFAGLITFDGLCFHNLRKVWKRSNINKLKPVQTKLQQFRIYA